MGKFRGLYRTVKFFHREKCTREFFLTRIIPVLRYITFTAIAKFLFDSGCDQWDLVAILVTSGINSNLYQVVLDGTMTSLSEDAWTTVELPSGTILGSVTNLGFNLSVHTIQSTSSDTRITAIVHRITLFKALTFSAGTTLPISFHCRVCLVKYVLIEVTVVSTT